MNTLGRGHWDEAVEFPIGRLDELIQATLDLTETVGQVQGNPLPALTWAYVNRKPRIKKATKIKEDYTMKELSDAVKRLEDTAEVGVKSAVDHLVLGEKELADKDNRAPAYFSRVMKDEVRFHRASSTDPLTYRHLVADSGHYCLQIFGFIFAGHETTSTTICWALKFLADQPRAQTKLRAALHHTFAEAKSEGRDINIKEMIGKHIPYLDATIEEVLRCAGTAPVVDRQASVDTEILGHPVPKGTIVTCLVTGPSTMSPAFRIDEGLRSPTSQAAKRNERDRAWDPDDIMNFNPDRWIVGGEFDAMAGPQLAFGLGTRGCYGKRLVYVEMRILLTLIVWNFELLRCPTALSSYKSELITTNEPRQCYVRLREIKEKEAVV